MTKDDEREALEWLGRAAIGFYETDKRHRATILALLDEPRMPRPEDVPDEAWQAANETFHRFAYTVPGIQAAYRALYDHYTQPAEPVVAWAVVNAAGDIIAIANGPDCTPGSRPGDRIVKLVEDRSE